MILQTDIMSYGLANPSLYGNEAEGTEGKKDNYFISKSQTVAWYLLLPA